MVSLVDFGRRKSGPRAGRSALGLAAVLSLGLLAGCAQPNAGAPQIGASGGLIDAAQPGDQQFAQSDLSDIYSDASPGDIWDPLEPLNRFIFAINDALDTFLIKPIAVTYHFWTPAGVQHSVTNFVRNLGAPVVLLNDVLQGEWDRAEMTAGRFFINSTAGFGGLFDVATDSGYPYHDEDFGQTLGTYGVGPGLYVVLPLFGPSNARDAVGLLVDSYTDPWNDLARVEDSNTFLYGRAAVTGLDLRARNIDSLDEVKRDAIDYYARLRSLYTQRRADQIRNSSDAEDAAGTVVSDAGKNSSQ
ncbi:phospholipid-binding lipoprotein MlaA [Tistlia consotensis]|uniref:Phospholipid-binding lipoprotein MlaA n=1 Tax=Tistlia consotensis USBA 355 TaxID=560819 RepID=A0A1Y6B807_9PROT|nr:VacJ family lipoprotein [Tistlia consotensis]SME97714.1 phospholipid-binding lipoprotein MlaA [Tistlia consotensis USBA 355]SNR57094.1 phospholipid-binding lipoprotein MlaA [Tistlia consotensis]